MPLLNNKGNKIYTKTLLFLLTMEISHFMGHKEIKQNLSFIFTCLIIRRKPEDTWVCCCFHVSHWRGLTSTKPHEDWFSFKSQREGEKNISITLSSLSKCHCSERSPTMWGMTLGYYPQDRAFICPKERCICLGATLYLIKNRTKSPYKYCMFQFILH